MGSDETSLKNQAKDIMVTVDKEIQAAEAKSLATQADISAKANMLFDTIFGVISDVDLETAEKRVQELRQKYPNASPAELSQKLISGKSRRTGTVGAATSGAGLIPGLGTAAAVTLGVAADVGMTFKLQAELVLEIAAVYDYPLTENEKQQLVMFITGLSAGTTALSRKAGETVAIKVGEKLATRSAQKAFTKALPVVGVIASAGTNVLSTYIIGQRADAYFRLGPEAVGSWGESLRAISGVDERKLAGWLADSGRSAGQVLASGAGKVGEVGKVAGGAVTGGATKVAETVGSGTQMAATTAQTGLQSYVRWVRSVRSAILRFFQQGALFLWRVISFVPRKLIGVFKRK